MGDAFRPPVAGAVWNRYGGGPRSGNGDGMSSGKASDKRWTGAAEPAIAVVQRPRFCDEMVKPLDEPFPALRRLHRGQPAELGFGRTGSFRDALALHFRRLDLQGVGLGTNQTHWSCQISAFQLLKSAIHPSIPLLPSACRCGSNQRGQNPVREGCFGKLLRLQNYPYAGLPRVPIVSCSSPLDTVFPLCIPHIQQPLPGSLIRGNQPLTLCSSEGLSTYKVMGAPLLLAQS